MTQRLWLLVFLYLFLPLESFAQPLVTCTGPSCNFCDFVAMINRISVWLVGILSILAVIGLVIAGLRLVISGGNTSAKEDAKKMFTNVVIGIIIVLAAWLIIDTIMKTLVNEGKLGRPWHTIECAVTSPARQATTEQPSLISGQRGEGTFSHADADALLTANAIRVISTSGEVRADCGTNTRCTSLEGIQRDVAHQAVEIRKGCPDCTITIIGGTEPGHAEGQYSHGNGYKIDVVSDPALNAFLERSLIQSGSRGGTNGGLRYLDSCGNEYVRESTHWDITVNNGVCGV